MKSKQLANVLLKILGLSMCLHSIPSIVSSITISCIPLWQGATPLSDKLFYQAIANGLSWAASGVIEIVIGVLVIAKSQKISERWFRNEDE